VQVEQEGQLGVRVLLGEGAGAGQSGGAAALASRTDALAEVDAVFGAFLLDRLLGVHTWDALTVIDIPWDHPDGEGTP
jgi:hypothetical protein